MKIKITLKDPDGVYRAIVEAAIESVNNTKGLTGEERDELIKRRQAKLGEDCEQWIEYGEYVTIEIDTDSGTAIVCEV